MKKTILSICLSAFLIVLSAQNKSEILITVGDESISATDFINTFNRNNSLSKATDSEIRDYLDLYIKFKLKVKDGLDSKIDTTDSFQRELESYKRQSAQQYLTDKEVTDKLVTEAMERSKLMVHASHLLILCPADASPKDTLAAYNKALNIRKQIVSGAITFNDAVIKYSEDPSAKDEVGENDKIQYGNGGDLSYFNAFDLIYPFESAAYNTKVGEISAPIRTQFGYHLIWVQDKQPVVSKINSTQILLLDKEARTGGISEEVKVKLDEIAEALKNGEDFSALAEKYTEDPVSKRNGGIVVPFAPNLRPGKFTKICISLEPNQISEPFPSIIGWHIVKLDELIKPEFNEDELLQNVTAKIQRDSRSSKSVESFIEKLKKEYNYSEKGRKAAFDLLLKKLNTESKLPATDELLQLPGIEKLKPIATYAKKSITIKDFITFLDRSKGLNIENQAKYYLDALYANFLKEDILKFEFENLGTKYPEYKELINEYHYGMILFEMNNERVWSESLKDTTSLQDFYENNKLNYLDVEGNPKPLTEIRSVVLTDFQNELEVDWLNRLKEKYPIWINEELLESILKNK